MVEVNNLTRSSVREQSVQKIALGVLTGENKREFNLSIAFVGERRMRELNSKYRTQNKSTDVLAFSFLGKKKFSTEEFQGVKDLGEVIVLLKEVKKNAKQYGVSYKQELVRVLVHGVLHLLGYDHEKSEKEAKVMFRKEEYYTAHFNSALKV